MVGAPTVPVKPGPCGGSVNNDCRARVAEPVRFRYPRPSTPNAARRFPRSARILTSGHPPWCRRVAGYASVVRLPELRSVDLGGPVAYRTWDGPVDTVFVLMHGLGASHLS